MSNHNLELIHYYKRLRTTASLIKTLATDAIQTVERSGNADNIALHDDNLSAMCNELSNLYTIKQSLEELITKIKQEPQILTDLV